MPSLGRAALRKGLSPIGEDGESRIRPSNDASSPINGVSIHCPGTGLIFGELFASVPSSWDHNRDLSGLGFCPGTGLILESSLPLLPVLGTTIRDLSGLGFCEPPMIFLSLAMDYKVYYIGS